MLEASARELHRDVGGRRRLLALLLLLLLLQGVEGQQGLRWGGARRTTGGREA
jgi:hypothetical protein